VNEWDLFHLEKDPGRNGEPLRMSGFKIHTGHEDVERDVVNQLKALRTNKDTTAGPVKLWPLNSYD
jgi:hypothetical protein